MPINKESSQICTIILPWGNYSFKRLPMGLCSAPDIFQNLMMQYLRHLDYVLVYIDDVIVISRKDETEEDHLRKIEVVLSILEEWGF